MVKDFFSGVWLLCVGWVLLVCGWCEWYMDVICVMLRVDGWKYLLKGNLWFNFSFGIYEVIFFIVNVNFMNVVIRCFYIKRYDFY